MLMDLVGQSVPPSSEEASSAGVSGLLPQWPDCDAMIARGAIYLDLCCRSLSIRVIELIINGTDIVNTLLQLRQKYGREIIRRAVHLEEEQRSHRFHGSDPDPMPTFHSR